MFKIAYINFHQIYWEISYDQTHYYPVILVKMQSHSFLIFYLFGQPSFSIILKPIEYAPISLSLEEFAVGAGHKVLMEVDDDIIMKQVPLNDLSLLL